MGNVSTVDQNGTSYYDHLRCDSKDHSTFWCQLYEYCNRIYFYNKIRMDFYGDEAQDGPTKKDRICWQVSSRKALKIIWLYVWGGKESQVGRRGKWLEGVSSESFREVKSWVSRPLIFRMMMDDDAELRRRRETLLVGLKRLAVHKIQLCKLTIDFVHFIVDVV
jgi:hypothetical protein